MSHRSCEDPSEPILALRLIRYLVLPKLQPTYKAPENDYLDECRRHERQANLGRRQPGTGFSSEAEPCDSLDAKTIFASSRVCRITPHDIRRAAATHLHLSGMPLKRLQAILGHNSLEMTQLYILEDEAQINGSHSPFDQLIDVE
jgi:integrase